MNSTEAKKPTRKQFETRLAKVRALQSILEAMQLTFACTYGPNWKRSYLSPKQLREYETTSERLSRSQDVFFDTLDEVGSRVWRAGIPVAWIIDNVSWDMATTREAIPVPPLAWGHSGNNELWARALDTLSPVS